MGDRPFDLKVFIVSNLRKAFKKTPMYRDARNRAKHEYSEESKHGKPLRRVHYKCASCGRFFVDRKGSREIAVDHIEPVVDTQKGWTNFEDFVQRLFCSVDNLQVLCNYKGIRDGTESCHKIKTAAERKAAALHRKEKRGKK